MVGFKYFSVLTQYNHLPSRRLLLEGVTMLLDTRTSYGTKILHMGPPNDTLQKEVSLH